MNQKQCKRIRADIMHRLYGDYREPGDTSLTHKKDRHDILRNEEFRDIWNKRKQRHLQRIRQTTSPQVQSDHNAIRVPLNMKRKGTERALLNFIGWWQMRKEPHKRPRITRSIIDRIADIFVQRKQHERKIARLQRDLF